jgi:surfactin synthase thioesterase subunit
MEFRSWATALPSFIEVIAVQLPGRGLRFGEPSITIMDDLIDSLLREVSGMLDRPLALFGHSLGGRIAFAFAERLSVVGVQAPPIVVVSASRPPGRMGKHDFNTFTDADLRRYIMQLGGTAPEIVLNNEMADLMLPVIRADYSLHESISTPSYKLNCPVIACGGIDDCTVSEADLRAWAELTSSSFELRLFPGGHFYLREVTHKLLSFMAERFQMRIVEAYK